MFGGTGDLEARRADIAAFDRLPPELRREICCSPYPPDSRKVLDLYNRLQVFGGLSPARAIGLIAPAFREVVAENLTQFSGDYLRRYGTPLPHVGADASLLVEDPWRVARRPSRGRLRGRLLASAPAPSLT